MPIRVYRWKSTPLGGEFDQLVTGIARRQFDAVSFTSAPAAAAVLERSRDLDIEDQLLEALRTDVHAMCVGPVTSQPLKRKGVPTSSPERMRLGALARHITEQLPLLGSCTVLAAGHVVDIRGTCVLVDGSIKLLSPSGMAILRALAQRPGDVVSRPDLLRVLPGNSNDPHAVDTAVLRLRTALDDKNIVATVVKRGYRLAVGDPGRCRMSLILVAHGTRRPGGVEMIGDLAARVSTLIGRTVQVAFVDVLGPTPSEVLSGRRRARDRGARVFVPRLSRAHRSARPRRRQRALRTSSSPRPWGRAGQVVRIVAEQLVKSGLASR